MVVVTMAMMLLSRSSQALATVQLNTARDSIATLIPRLNNSQQRNAELEQEVALQAEQYSADSLSWATERDALRAVADEADITRRRLEDDLGEHMAGDTVGLAMLDSLSAQHGLVVSALSEEIRTLQEERAALWQQRNLLNLRVASLETELFTARDLFAQSEIVASSLESQLSAERGKKWGMATGAAALLVIMLIR